MELEDKIKCVLMDFEINEITLQEATRRILLLLDVVGRSEQLFCECPNNFEIYQETKIYHSSCNKEVKVIRKE